MRKFPGSKWVLPGLAAITAGALAVGADITARTVVSARQPQGAAFADPPGPDEGAALAALRQAVTLRQTVIVPSNAQAGRHPSSSDVNNMVERGRKELAQKFAFGALETAQGDLASAARTENTPEFQALDGGADSFDFTSQAVDQHTVLVQGSYRAWAKMAQLHDGKTLPASPSNIIDCQATLSDSSGQWMVIDLHWTFHPGSEP